MFVLFVCFRDRPAQRERGVTTQWAAGGHDDHPWWMWRPGRYTGDDGYLNDGWGVGGCDADRDDDDGGPCGAALYLEVTSEQLER